MPFDSTLNFRLDHFRSLLLFVLALVNYALMYTANIVLARSLDIGDFDDYSVAISIVTMLSTIATLGLEKHALRVMPLLSDRRNWSRLRGFWLFSLGAISAFSVVLMALLSIGLELVLALRQADYHIAIIAYAGFLPVIALTLFLVEVIAAQGAYLMSIALYRLLLPVLYVSLLFAAASSPFRLSALAAVVCYGCAWAAILVIMWRVANNLLPNEVLRHPAQWAGKKWLKNSLPLVMNSLMLTIMTSSGVVILELLFPSGLEVGVYAVAAQTGGFLSLLGTSTNRYYLPLMVVLIDHKDRAAMQKLMRQRAWVVGGSILLLLSLLYFFGGQILSLFGGRFNEGYYATVVIAVGAATSALFADIPYYLQFMGFHREVLGLTLSATLSMLALSFVLGKRFGALGVALAYMLPVMLLFIGLRIIADLRFRRLR